MKTPVNFELAKLLKEIGFDEPCYDAYNVQGMKFSNGWLEYIFDNNIDIPFTKKELKSQDILAPTIAEVVMWLYEKHGIWIMVMPIPYSDNLTHWRWEHISSVYATRNLRWKKEQDYMSPKEAYEAAIEYTLKNLI